MIYHCFWFWFLFLDGGVLFGFLFFWGAFFGLFGFFLVCGDNFLYKYIRCLLENKILLTKFQLTYTCTICVYPLCSMQIVYCELVGCHWSNPKGHGWNPAVPDHDNAPTICMFCGVCFNSLIKESFATRRCEEIVRNESQSKPQGQKVVNI